jgi:hypothetical protein
MHWPAAANRRWCFPRPDRWRIPFTSQFNEPLDDLPAHFPPTAASGARDQRSWRGQSEHHAPGFEGHVMNLQNNYPISRRPTCLKKPKLGCRFCQLSLQLRFDGIRLKANNTVHHTKSLRVESRNRLPYNPRTLEQSMGPIALYLPCYRLGVAGDI